MKPELLPAVLDSFARLEAEADLVLVEGAGSASEVNLRANDIANMGFARAADVPVVLIGDIDRGGVIASLVGTKAVIDRGRRRDDARLHRQQVSRRSGAVRRRHGERSRSATGWPALGLVPYFADARLLPAEDALALDRRATGEASGAGADRGADPAAHRQLRRSRSAATPSPTVELVRVRPGSALPGDADLVILPGSKATIADLAALRAAGCDIDIAAHLRRGGRVLGLCGGYQMLGRTIADPPASKAPPARSKGSACSTSRPCCRTKSGSRPCAGTTARRQPVRGLRDAHGRDPRARLRAAVCAARRRIVGRRDLGRRARDRHLCPRPVRRRPAARRLAGAARRRPSAIAYDALVDDTLDRLAAHLAAHLDLDALLGLSR